ncbi:MAG: bifunctional diguanylate cyclase/phosphodiesterase [Epsilonproteobacteria bacterium]|nr:MAG: bifunctional diguanylate cyclase/phosphodiesterase [Campylobacterota bacterium]
MVRKKELFLFLLLLLLAIFFIYVYGYVKQTKEEIFTRVEQNKILNIKYYFQNIENEIIKSNDINDSSSLVYLLSDKDTRKKYEKNLALLITPGIKYIYILAKDEKERFRFLLDASRTDKAHFYQKFDVKDEKYKEVYRVASPQIIRQKNMENLSLTYLYPIKVNGEVIALLSVDITTRIEIVISSLIEPLETFFVILIIFVFLLILMTSVQVFHYFITRKKIFTDPLTELFNRNYLQEIAPMINLEKYSVAMLDLDRFKVINDTYGHKTGDFVLAQSSQILKKSTRDSDIVIRYGGEEFLLFIYNREEDKQESATAICERIRKNISEYTFNYEKEEIKMQVSIGLHENPSLEKNLNEAIKIADKMLYIAKNRGRNRVVTYNEKLKNSTESKTKDINFVKLALEEERVVCHYQPIYNHADKKIFKYEALVRLIAKDGEVIFPAHFLPELKHTNVHYKLTQRILLNVFEEFENRENSVSINVNFSDLINADIENSIISALTSNPDLASRITFEILESDEITDITLFKQKIELLHSLGAKVSIDDFGSGYSNFRTILDIEANYLKIDGSLIKNIDKNEKDFKVVKSIIHFAKEANMKTIAEFVHSKEVYDKLLQLDLDYMQGYYIAKPSASLLNEKELFA